MYNDNVIFKLSFDYQMLDNVLLFLNNNKITILNQSFDSIVSIYIKVLETTSSNILSRLITICYKQIKIEKIEAINEEFVEGTDKPIGSKNAIDEN